MHAKLILTDGSFSDKYADSLFCSGSGFYNNPPTFSKTRVSHLFHSPLLSHIFAELQSSDISGHMVFHFLRFACFYNDQTGNIV